MTGTALTDKLTENIKTSMELRSRIPYLDMLRELAEGGATLSSATLNTSSNFGSFDHYLAEVLHMLQAQIPSFPVYQLLPLPLSVILNHLTENSVQISLIFQHEIDTKPSENEFQYRLDLIDAAAV